MNVNRKIRKVAYTTLCSVTLLTSCQSKMDEYYELPDWLKGNAWEILEKNGDYTMFLKGVERVGYSELVQGKGIITVMAPNDEAFMKYLTSKGYSSVDDMPYGELERVITFHLLYYSFDKERLSNYKPQGIEADDTATKGLFYKFRSHSTEGVEEVVDPVSGTKKKVYHREHFLPVLSNNLFNTKGIDAKSNYEFFYPESVWTGSDGFNISNSSVNEYAVITDNGYLYRIDKVLEPLPTIHSYLSNRSEYSEFLGAYNRFTQLEYNSEITSNYGGGDSLFLYSSDLLNIASEWTSSDYAALNTLSGVAYNIFAPTNEAMNKMFEEHFKGENKYNSLSEVNMASMILMLGNHHYKGNVCFPEEIEKGKLTSSWGTPIQFERTEAVDSRICSNGTIYGLKNALVPDFFTTVGAPVHEYPEFTMFQWMLSKSNMVFTLTSDALDYALFIPSDKTLKDYSQYEGKSLNYSNATPKIYGTDDVLIEGEGDVLWVTLSSARSNAIVRNHICAGESVAERGDEKIWKTYNSYDYLYQKGDELYSSYTYNGGIAPQKVEEIKTYGNGTAYRLIGDEASALMPEYSQFKSYIAGTAITNTHPFYFAWLFQKTAGFHNTVPSFNFMQGERFITLIPSREAVLANSRKFPTNAAAAAEYWKYYYVNVRASALVDYPFAGTGINTEVETFSTYVDSQTGMKMANKLRFEDVDGQLTITDQSGNTVNVISYFPNIYADGAAYVIDGVLSVE